jgi:hypothetical protein
MGQTMGQTMVVRSVRLEKKLIEKLEKECGSDVSSFIRDALWEKLSRKKNELDEFNSIVDHIDQMNPVELHSNLSDLLLTTTLMYEEMKKQNAILKLIHRRSTFASRFSSVILDTIKGKYYRPAVGGSFFASHFCKMDHKNST